MKKAVAVIISFLLVLAISYCLAEEYQVNLKIGFEENLMFSTYDADMLLDGKKITTMPHGKGYEDTVYLSSGKHELKFNKKGDGSVNGSYVFSVESDSIVSCKIHAKNNKIKITDQKIEKVAKVEEKPSEEPNNKQTDKNRNESSPDDSYIVNILLKYADSLGKVSYEEIKEYLDSLGLQYETAIGPDELAKFDIPCELGRLYISFYPLGNNESDFGNPKKEMLSCLEYSREDLWITVSDHVHIQGTMLKTGDKSRDPVNQEVPSLEKLIEFYNNEIGGNVSLDSGSTVFTDSDRKSQVEQTIKERTNDKYTKTTIQRIEVNSNAGTANPDDFIVLVYYSWGTKNDVKNTKAMLEMFSDDMAVTLVEKYEHVSEIVLFWEVPYLVENGTCAKYSYEVRNGGAYLTEKFGPLYR